MYSPESFKRHVDVHFSSHFRSKDVTVEFGKSPDKKLPRKALDELSVQDLAPLPSVSLAEKPVSNVEEMTGDSTGTKNECMNSS